MNAQFYEKSEDNKVHCYLCPHNCVISEGKAGICGVRENNKGELSLPFYGKLSALSMDPIEKKPLYHFYPGSQILSAGFVGCNFRCPFCQNFQISQYTDAAQRDAAPEQLAALAEEQGSIGVAYTYSEPLVHAEYLIDAAAEVSKRKLKNVIVTNGFISPEPGEKVFAAMDAANIDLKSMNTDFYKKEIKGMLGPVLETIRIAAKLTSLEVTTLIIPGKNDSEEEMRQLAGFLADVDPNIPLHLSRYYPTYKYTIKDTTTQSVRSLAETANEYLNYVYLGNVGMEETNTFCHNCGELIVQRSGYRVSIRNTENGTCAKCGTNLPVIMKK